MIKRRAALSWANSEAAQTQLERGGLDPFDPFPWRQGERKTPTVEHGPRLFAKRGWASPCVLAAVARPACAPGGIGVGTAVTRLPRVLVVPRLRWRRAGAGINQSRIIAMFSAIGRPSRLLVTTSKKTSCPDVSSCRPLA